MWTTLKIVFQESNLNRIRLTPSSDSSANNQSECFHGRPKQRDEYAVLQKNLREVTAVSNEKKKRKKDWYNMAPLNHPQAAEYY